MSAPTPTIKGLTTISWGTGGELSDTGLTNAVVISGRFTPKNKGALEDVENGDGASVALVVMDDGFSAELEILFDSALTLPAVGDFVKVQRPTDDDALDCVLTSIEQNTKRKGTATITLAVEYRPGIEAPEPPPGP